MLGMFLLVATLAFVSGIQETTYIGDYKVVYSYSGAEEDETFTLSVDITNEDTENKTDVKLTIDASDPFDVNNDVWDIGNLSNGETKSGTFRVEVDRNTAQGKYDLDFNLEDSEDDYDDAFEIQVDSRQADLIIGDIQSLPSTIMPNQENVKLMITIENIGGGDAEFTKAKLNLPLGITSSSSYSDSTNLGTISSGLSKTATFYVDLDKTIKSGDKKATLVLDYRSDSDDQDQSLEFDIPVKGKPQFEVIATKVNPSKVSAGESGNLEITIKNIGEEEGKETSIRVFENTDHPIEFDKKTSLIGNIVEGASGSAVFAFDVNNNAIANNYLVKIQVRSVSQGEVFVEEHTVNLLISDSEGTSLVVIFSGIAIALVVLLIVLVLLLRRR